LEKLSLASENSEKNKKNFLKNLENLKNKILHGNLPDAERFREFDHKQYEL
jgi:hypothetical protein